ncbi:ATP-dependent DNA helicase [Paralcaligenes sp. KSB-10]|uniref:ATP-dependent DNA helicase n=1 Tax=Paralcaligenes sp. KSB-10 TaxID=2901142 RepID=UPI001E3A8E64|nr:ATP-dependent DNA helicase [Paralcaligenes sp. KSB-10]UHL64705.1 ATP-dependent DNA helicase [Paralcaligenes sp. KSB-10]
MKYTVAVRTLCEFTAKQGDLDLRFTPSPTAREGIAGHALVASRRGADYQSEISLAGEFQHLTVRGRADGYDPVQNQLEEIKTFRGELASMPANHRYLHWAQVKVYGHLLCEKLGLPELRLALVYFDIVAKQETVLNELYSAATLKKGFESQCRQFLDWAAQELAHRVNRDHALDGLRFPYAQFRTGQRPLSVAVYKAARSGLCLAAQAPTGIGKTVGTLFPLLKAAPAAQLDKLFFLTAKTSGRNIALNALAQIRNMNSGTPLRIIELVARDKACEHPDKACHGASCPLALGFYDRLPAARQAALDTACLDKQALRRIASEHRVCPYYLGHELVRWCDVVVGDFNYYFDSSAMLHGLTVANQWRVGLLVDEAHNLIERARKMYTAELEQAALTALRRSAPPALKKTLGSVSRCWNELLKNQPAPYQTYNGVPAKFIAALQRAAAAIIDYQTDNPTHADSSLQRFYFDALHFLHIAELFDTHSLFDIAVPAACGGAAGQQSVLCLRNIIPAPFLAPRFNAAHCTTLFSATLTPRRFYSDILGLPPDSAWIDVESPFRPEQLTVQVARRISTRYQHREASLQPMADLMAMQYSKQPGNYLIFLSSFDYLRQLSALFKSRHPGIPIWEQARHMDETEREAFLERFTEAGRGFGFAVLGGAFAEGIDLPGQRLIGAFIATLGLPQINPANEQIRERMGMAFGGGYEYAYLYPGIRKVVQAAGRVIRTQSDQGVVYLMDDRFNRPQVRGLLPKWWRVTCLEPG